MPRFRLLRRHLVAAALLGVSWLGCLNLANENQIKDLRILAVKLDPPEVVYSFLHLFPPEGRAGLPLGPYPMTAQVLAVDPQGRQVELSVRLCPEDETIDLGCEGYIIRSNATDAQITAMRPLVAPTRYTRQADLTLGGELAVPSVMLNYTDVALDYMLPHTANGDLDLGSVLLAPTLPSVVVRAKVKDVEEQEVAFKRFSLALDISPQGVPDELRVQLETLFEAFLGVPFCPPGTDFLADVQCVKPRVANRNPTVERVLYKMGGDIEAWPDPSDVTSNGQLQDLVGRLVVRPGDEVRLRVVLADGDLEPYQAFSFDIAASKVVLQNYLEDPAFTWYTTNGDTPGTTTTQFSKTADATWTVSLDSPEGPAFVWVVVRDQRGGVDWRRLDFEVRFDVSNGGGGGGFFNFGGGGGGGGPRGGGGGGPGN